MHSPSCNGVTTMESNMPGMKLVSYTWTVQAYPQGSPSAPPVATLTTRSITVADDVEALFRKDGFHVVRRTTENK